MRENILVRSEEHEAAADRALTRVREWHRIHRLLNHPAKKVTDKAYLSGKYGRKCDARIYSRLPHHTEKYCITCDRGKFAEDNGKMFQDSKNKHHRPGECWHADLVGPLPESAKGYRYMATFTDTASGYMMVDHLKTKGKAHRSLTKLHKHLESMRAETKKGHKIYKIRRLVTDRGGEFTSRLSGAAPSPFNRGCTNLGIDQKFTSAYKSRQNGRAERTNRTLAEGMRCAIIDSNMGWAWWPEAAKYAAFTANRLIRPPSQLRKSRDPTAKGSSHYTRLTGLESDNTKMVAFGQAGERALPKPKKKKGVLIRSESVRMVGYAEETKGYIVIDKKGKQWKTNQVKFSHVRQPVNNGIDEKEDKKACKALIRDPRHIDDDICTPAKRGLIKGMDDGELRKMADKCEREIIKFKSPIHHSCTTGDAAIRVAKRPKFGDGMSPEAATKQLTKFMHSNGKLFMHFKQGNMKAGGKNESKYNEYKKIVTLAEYIDAVKSGKISGSASTSKESYKSGDAHYDLQKGHLKISNDPVTSAALVHEVMMMTNKGGKNDCNLLNMVDDAKVRHELQMHASRIKTDVWKNIEDLNLNPIEREDDSPTLTEHRRAENAREAVVSIVPV